MSSRIQDEYEAIRAWWTAGPRELAKEENEDGHSTCVYRGDHDPSSQLRCAFGCRIPDELYDPAMDGEEDDAMSVIGLFQSFDDLRSHFGVSTEAVKKVATEFSNPEVASIEDIPDDEEIRLVFFWLQTQRIHDAESMDAEDFVGRLDEFATQFGLTPVT